MHGDGDDDQRKPRKPITRADSKLLQKAKSKAHKATLEVPITNMAEEPDVRVEVITEAEYLRTTHQYINVAVSEPPKRRMNEAEVRASCMKGCCAHRTKKEDTAATDVTAAATKSSSNNKLEKQRQINERERYLSHGLMNK